MTPDTTNSTQQADSSTTTSSADEAAAGSDEEPATETNTQVGLTDISYEGHTVPEPPEDRVTVETVEHDEFYETDVGDVLWVDDTEYVVVDLPRRLIGPTPRLVVGEDGKQGELVAGELPNGSADGLAWAGDLAEKEQGEVSRSDITCSYDRVSKLEENSLEHIHRWAPDTDQRVCPACDRDGSGDPLRIEKQAAKTVELRRCVNTDCKFVYRFVRDLPAGEPATVITNSYKSDSFGVETISGVFRCEEQDDFKFPVETNQGRDDGFFTAGEIAEFLNPKMANPAVTALLEADGTASASDVLDAMDLVTETSNLTGGEEFRSINSVGELFDDYVSDRLIPSTETLREPIANGSRETFFRAMMFLRRVIPDKPAYHEDEPEPTGFDIEADEAADLVARTIEDGKVPDTAVVSEDVLAVLREAFEADLTGEDVVTEDVFKELQRDHTEGEIFGVVETDVNRSDEFTVTWKDDGGHRKKMRVEFTEFSEGYQFDQRRFRWSMDSNHLSEILP